MMKKTRTILAAAILAVSVFSACSADGSGGKSFDNSKGIDVFSREDGSGTRGAFIELFGIEVKDSGGAKKDLTTKEANIVDKTDVMIISVVNNIYAVGYISLGSMNSGVKALSVDGVPATVGNVKNGSYNIARPFIIATKGEASGLTADFISFILSKEGQEIIGGGYIAINDGAPAYSGSAPKGKITVAGSSSVTPIMEKLQEAYISSFNPDAIIEIQMNDSTSGMSAAMSGTCDIGMSSRELKDSEKEQLTGIQIALDGIAVIVNPLNPLSDVTSGQVKAIFTGEIVRWDKINE
jgi:phosphate transport system substrate-binding protein